MGRLTVAVHTDMLPADDEWAAYIAQVRDHLPLEEQRGLAISAGGSPNGKQRKMMTDQLGGAKVPFAILTNSMLMRSASTAVSWFNPQLKVFGPNDLEQAIAYLQLTSWERSETLRTVADFQDKLGIHVANHLKTANK